MKKTAPMSSNLKLVAVFAAGMAVATFAWWQSDRLNLAYGANLGINEIDGGANPRAMGVKNCSPSDKKEKSHKIDGCNVAVAETTCVMKRDYLTVEKTKSGKHLAVHAMPSKDSTERISYDKVVENVRSEVKSELEKTSKELENLKKMKPWTELAKDNDYQEKMNYKKELDQVVKTRPACLAATNK